MRVVNRSRNAALAANGRGANRGLSIVELLIGIAVGLFVLAGATMVVANQLADNKRLMLETQIQQDMRTAMDVIVRDVRRSGYSYFADELQAVGAPTAVALGYQPAGIMDPANPLIYSYSSVQSNADNRTASTAEAADRPDFKGFRLQDGVIQVQLGLNNWQALTDANVVDIKTFTAVQVPITANLPTCALPPCASANACGDQRVVTRDITLTMVGEARHDPTVRRRLDATVRVRNDEVCL